MKPMNFIPQLFVRLMIQTDIFPLVMPGTPVSDGLVDGQGRVEIVHQSNITKPLPYCDRMAVNGKN